MTETMATVQRKAGDQPMEAVHESEREWEMLRFSGQWSKMLFHPRPDRPTEPNAGLVRYEPGAHNPLHRHDFAQVWYILEGIFTIDGRTYKPGTMIHHPDPHYEEELRTETGGVILFVQYQGPSTGGRPIYDGRFNVAARKPLSEEQLDV
jgi:quercetin dioxygenase-like cupin family protein